MNSIIDSVTASRRLKIFMTYYVMMYVVFNLLLNLLKNYVSFFGGGVGYLVYKFILFLMEAPFVYGMVRGIITKNYKVSYGLGAFGEVKNYGVYAMYVLVNIAYEVLDTSVRGLANSDGALAVAVSVILTLFIVVKLLVNFYLVSLYFESIDAGGGLALVKSIDKFVKVLGREPLKVLGAELLIMVSRAVALLITSTLASVLPSHAAINLVVLSLNDILYGFLILIWPVYYLYYRYILEE